MALSRKLRTSKPLNLPKRVFDSLRNSSRFLSFQNARCFSTYHTITEPPAGSEGAATPLTETIRNFLDPADFHQMLGKNGFNFFCGVPDSLLRDFCAYLTDNVPAHAHVITANEGAAIGVAAGHHLASGGFPMVYLQNSGLGNIVNPILSLADQKVYKIPMLLLVGWRGEPGKKDEPQHIVQGKVMPNLLADMNIPFEVLPDYPEGAEEAIQSCLYHLRTRGGPYAFLVKRQTFSKYKLQTPTPTPCNWNREDVLREVVRCLGEWDAIVSTTGFASRELYELRDELGQDHSREFLTVGSMGHSSAIGLGIALTKPSKNVFCLDGDGAALMHMGTMGTIGKHAPANYGHILINNGAHDSVGGQPTGAFNIDFPAIARAVGYTTCLSATNAAEITAGIEMMQKDGSGPSFMEVRCNIGARSNLGRPKSTPIQNKELFMRFLQN